MMLNINVNKNIPGESIMKKNLSLLLVSFFVFASILNAQWVLAGGPNEAIIDPIITKGTSLFAGTAGNGGIYRSVDNGDNWTAANSGIQYPGKVYGFCLLGQKIVAAVNTDIFISANNGDSWQKITPPNNNYDINSVAYDGTYLFAALHGSGIARSGDEGLTWTLYTSGITDKTIWTILIADTKIFIGTNTGIFTSSDKGVNWQTANTGITANSSGFKSFAKIGSDLFVCSNYGGVHKSIDNGQNWTAVVQGLQTTNARKIFSTGTDLFVSTDGGIHRSTNGGTNWTKINTGTLSEYSNNFAAVGNTIFVANSSRGIYKTTNIGTLWTQCNKGMTNSTTKTFLRIGSTLYAGAYYSGGVHNTSNGGTTWNHSYPSVSNVFQLVNNNNDIYAATAGWGLFRSVDNGVNWTALTVNNPDLLNVYSAAIGNNKIFIGTATNGVYVSNDNGATWIVTNNNLTARNINMLTFVGTKLFAATSAGIVSTTDYGATWSQVSLSGKNIITIKANNNKIFAGTWGDGIYISTDNGATWTQSNNGMTYLLIYAITFDNNNNVYVSCGANVFSSKDGGANWVLKNEGLPMDVFGIEVMDNYLYAGTNTYGVYKRPLSELVTSINDKEVIPLGYKLEQNYPNPFNPTTTIRYSIPKAGLVALKVYDLQGKEVATLVNEFKQPGNYNSPFSLQNSRLASGIYFYKITSGKYSETKKMIILK